MRQIIHLHACRHDRLCNGRHAYVAHNATACVSVWQTKQCMHARAANYSLGSRLCDFMHTCATHHADVFMCVWRIQLV